MNPIVLISNSFRSEHIDLPCNPVEGICTVTGLLTKCVPRKYALGKSFTNIDLLTVPSSNMISVDAYQVLKYKWQRMSSWLCNGKEFKRLDRVAVRPLVLNGVDTKYWCGHVTTSYKKHGGLRAKVNNSKYGLWVFDEKIVDCRDAWKVRGIYEILDDAIRKGIGRTVLLSLNAPPYLISKVGFKYWMSLVQWARPLYQGNLYLLLVYLLPSQLELKRELTAIPSRVVTV